MKKTRKLFSALLAVVMVLSLSLTAFAIEEPATLDEEEQYTYRNFDPGIDSTVKCDTSNVEDYEDQGVLLRCCPRHRF